MNYESHPPICTIPLEQSPNNKYIMALVRHASIKSYAGRLRPDVGPLTFYIPFLLNIPSSLTKYGTSLA